jgi:hypothetical protein
MMPKYTSTTAYREHVIDGKATSQKRRILWLLQNLKPMTRLQIAHLFGERTFLHAHPEIDGPEIPLASVCGRVNALIEAGLVKVEKEDVNPVTGHRAEYLTAVQPHGQMNMFEGFMP